MAKRLFLFVCLIKARLRQEHLQRQHALLSTDAETLTIGQTGVLKELKLANDNLRWRLEQRHRVIASQNIIISGLQQQLCDMQSELGDLHVKYNTLLTTSSASVPPDEGRYANMDLEIIRGTDVNLPSNQHVAPVVQADAHSSIKRRRGYCHDRNYDQSLNSAKASRK